MPADGARVPPVPAVREVPGVVPAAPEVPGLVPAAPEVPGLVPAAPEVPGVVPAVPAVRGRGMASLPGVLAAVAVWVSLYRRRVGCDPRRAGSSWQRANNPRAAVKPAR